MIILRRILHSTGFSQSQNVRKIFLYSKQLNMSVNILQSVKGCREDAKNDILYVSPQDINSDKLVIYFGGDVQDYTEEMNKNSEAKRYTKWSLNNMATHLHNKFPQSHVMIIKPSKMEDNTFACYYNFVEQKNKYGVPVHCSYYHSLEQLYALIGRLMEKPPDSLELKIIGFSKGCVVLNQFLFEFHYLQNTADISSYPELKSFVKKITDMYWLDCGHNGVQNVWITSNEILQVLHDMRIKIHVHVTPYQISDSRRPHIGQQEHIFVQILQGFGADVHRVIHFKDKKPSLNNHFNVLDLF